MQKKVFHCLESWGLKKTDERTFHWFLVRELTRLMNIGGENRGYSYKVNSHPMILACGPCGIGCVLFSPWASIHVW